MSESLVVEDFLERSSSLPILDVRTPAEFAKAHIPGAYNLPLFSDEERAFIGTTYKQQGRDAAIMEGLDIVGGRMRHLVEEARCIVQHHKEQRQSREQGKDARTKNLHADAVLGAAPNAALLHCWRGGMRSKSVAWLLNFAGMHVHTLHGGYKAYRRFVLETFARQYQLYILGGYTGTRKTQILSVLRSRGEYALDLEALAHHKGSAFGGINEEPQPTVEQFENDIADCLRGFDISRRIWIEDESRTIGQCRIPDDLWQQMRTARTFFLDIPFADRLRHICQIYGQYPTDKLKEAIQRIEKRLGGMETRKALLALDEGDIASAAAIALTYYDRSYRQGLERRSNALNDPALQHHVSNQHKTEPIMPVAVEIIQHRGVDIELLADELLQRANARHGESSTKIL